MKKLLILGITLLTGGLALPAAAQRHCNQAPVTTVFISGYLPCGSPIYSKRVRHGNHYHSERLTVYELSSYLERQRRIAAQREFQRRLERERYIRIHNPRWRQRYQQQRCR
ncbi:hypothetical protein N9C66_05555 [Akkermansiaceae bacterium]|nr:hypothetical protein [Akkermansiaceae bacterium]MDA9830788.1 hypothetical protein [Akkermansiaceae bacterium]MDB4809496.1 hypothetical protein [bacterium]